MRTRLAYLIPYAMLALALVFRLYDPWPVKQLRLLVFDSFQRIAPRIFDPRKSPARIVAIDEASLKRIGQWPWPRTLVAKLVDRLSSAGAAAIVFDIIFAEPDGSSPENAVKQLRLLVFDSFQRIAPRIFDPRKSPARIVAIDEASLKRIGQWPWPRTLVAKLVDRLSMPDAVAGFRSVWRF